MTVPSSRRVKSARFQAFPRFITAEVEAAKVKKRHSRRVIYLYHWQNMAMSRVTARDANAKGISIRTASRKCVKDMIEGE